MKTAYQYRKRPCVSGRKACAFYDTVVLSASAKSTLSLNFFMVFSLRNLPSPRSHRRAANGLLGHTRSSGDSSLVQKATGLHHDFPHILSLLLRATIAES